MVLSMYLIGNFLAHCVTVEGVTDSCPSDLGSNTASCLMRKLELSITGQFSLNKYKGISHLIG